MTLTASQRRRVEEPPASSSCRNPPPSQPASQLARTAAPARSHQQNRPPIRAHGHRLRQNTSGRLHWSGVVPPVRAHIRVRQPARPPSTGQGPDVYMAGKQPGQGRQAVPRKPLHPLQSRTRKACLMHPSAPPSVRPSVCPSLPADTKAGGGTGKPEGSHPTTFPRCGMPCHICHAQTCQNVDTYLFSCGSSPPPTRMQSQDG